MSVQKCSQPGCFGSIEDGYCNVCGMPPNAPVTPVPQAAQPLGTTEKTATTPPKTRPQQLITQPVGLASGSCPQAYCRGQIVDGYCNVCGQPPIVQQVPNVLGAPLLDASQSAQLGTVAIGSKLAGGEAKRPLSSWQSSRTRIGAGITNVPPAPPTEPASAIMAEAVVPETRRFCPVCERPVGRGDNGKPGSERGRCEECQTPFDFRPSIEPGELVAGQYEVVGCLAYGGMGWIYLARDKNVSDRWVVLKGLLNDADEDAAASAKSEGQFLAKVEHPMIVEIYNFVAHGKARYIVMEYVPGRSITDLLKHRRAENGGQPDPLPVDWALAYIIEILPALGYLHSKGLLFCDFKPDNLMQVDDSLKLIDLGSVRRIGDDTSPIYGTLGYQAPEVAEQGCSIASDIYAVGRSLMMMCTVFKNFQTDYVDKLPPPGKIEQLAQFDSLYRLVQRACAPDPADRFQSAEMMRAQCLGVLREVVGRSFGKASITSHDSALFTDPDILSEDQVDWRSLPQFRSDVNDPMREWLTSLEVGEPARRIKALADAPQRTPAVILAELELNFQLNKTKAVDRLISELKQLDPWDWRAVWIQAIAHFRNGNWRLSVPAFNTVYSQLPGEMAPKFALALACERAELPQHAEQLFAICASTDSAYVAASAFGMARIRVARGDIRGSLDALDLVPAKSRGFAVARKKRAELLLSRSETLTDLADALDALKQTDYAEKTKAKFRVEILEKALDSLGESGNQPATAIGGKPATDRNVRAQLEQAYASLAYWTQDRTERNRLLSNADAKRKWSLF